MRTRLLLIPALLATVAVGYATTSSAASPPWTVERYYTSETWHSFADVGARGAGPGDVYTSQQSLTSSEGKAVGVVNGFGVNLRKPYVFFHWTASLNDGTLTLESAIDLKDNSAVYPISGGTGRYSGARGTVTLTDAGKDRSLAVVRYRR
jgi:hypothetical protein